MPEAASIAHFERRLVELDCPAVKLREKVRELAEHHEDLKQAALEEGLSEAEAESWAQEQLGEPVTLAEQVAAVLRQSSWWGRHPVVAFGLLPPVAVFLAVCGALALDFLFSRLYFPPAIFSVLADQPPDLKFLQIALVYSSYAAIGLTAMWFCVAANRSASGLWCALSACGASALFSFFVNLRVEPHTLAYGCNIPVGAPNDWVPVLLPLAVGMAACVRRWIWVRQFAPIPVPGPAGSRLIRARRGGPASAWWTPTTATVCLLIVGLVAGARLMRADILKRQARQEELVSKIWPAERAAVVERLNNRGPAPGVMLRAVPLSLKNVANVELADSLAGPGDASGNVFPASLEGNHVFAGIPFKVEGRVQLLGRSLLASNPTLPVRARGIEVGARCERIFLLHGASGLTAEMAGAKVAELVLHYADGSKAALPVLAGRDLRDWWGPIYETEAGAATAKPGSAATELAWAGVNPEIEREKPEWSLRIYRTIFRNPHPELKVVSADYVSAAGEASPFLLGLTVE